MIPVILFFKDWYLSRTDDFVGQISGNEKKKKKNTNKDRRLS